MTLTNNETSTRARRPLNLAALLVSAAVLAACGGGKDKPASQTAARVNKDEVTVHQINFVLQQQRGLKPEQADGASRQILERLVDQQLALQKAEDLKVDRDPRVMQQIDAARREIIARAYIERVGDAAPKPSPEEIKKYYDEKPALFSDRRIYSIQEIAIEAKPDQIPELRDRLSSAKNITEFTDYLKSKDLRFSGNQAVRAAEQLPLNSLEQFAKMKDGQAVLIPAQNGVQVVLLAGSRSQPVNEEQARPAIEQFLLNDRKRKLAEDDIKALRAAAKIEYVGKFAEAASGAASGGTAAKAALPAPAASAASDAQANAISQGLGIKK
jgi:EpsD family peptidyl-prolyl cis-trans isomerase